MDPMQVKITVAFFIADIVLCAFVSPDLLRVNLAAWALWAVGTTAVPLFLAQPDGTAVGFEAVYGIPQWFTWGMWIIAGMIVLYAFGKKRAYNNKEEGE